MNRNFLTICERRFTGLDESTFEMGFKGERCRIPKESRFEPSE